MDACWDDLESYRVRARDARTIDIPTLGLDRLPVVNTRSCAF